MYKDFYSNAVCIGDFPKYVSPVSYSSKTPGYIFINQTHNKYQKNNVDRILFTRVHLKSFTNRKTVLQHFTMNWDILCDV